MFLQNRDEIVFVFKRLHIWLENSRGYDDFEIIAQQRCVDVHCRILTMVHERIGGKLPLIGVGNLYTPREILEEFNNSWSEFIGLGKMVMKTVFNMQSIQNAQIIIVSQAYFGTLR